jgi:hypothetical protein
MVLSSLFALAVLTAQESRPWPRIETTAEGLVLTLANDVEVLYRLDPLGVRAVRLADGGLVEAYGDSEFTVDGARPLSGVLVDQRVDGGAVVLELELRSSRNVLRVRDSFEPLLASDLDPAHVPALTFHGVVRRVSTTLGRQPSWSDPNTTTASATFEVAELVPSRALQVTDECSLYGVSYVDRPGTEYTLLLGDRWGTGTAWSYVAGNSKDRGLQLAPDHDARWTAALVRTSPESERLTLRRSSAMLAEALTENPIDKRELSRLLSPERHRARYEQPVQRVLDPEHGRLGGWGTASDPWPGLFACYWGQHLSVVAEESRLVLCSGDHGAFQRGPGADGEGLSVVLVGPARDDARPATLAPLDKAVEGLRFELSGAVTVELSGAPPVPRHVTTPTGRFATDWGPTELEGATLGERGWVSARPTRLDLTRDLAVLGIEFAGRSGPREGTERLRAVQVAGTWGIVRRIIVPRRDLRFDEPGTVLVAPNERATEPTVSSIRPPLEPERGDELVLACRGVYWDVCAFARTYVVVRRRLADGSARWWLRYGHTTWDQCTDQSYSMPLVEAQFLASADSKLDLGELLAALVEVPEDRRALLEQHAPATFRREYPEGR